MTEEQITVPAWNIIFASDPDGRIGISSTNTLPWPTSKEDMSYFKSITSLSDCESHTKKSIVIMGRKTWESIPIKHRPLSNRINIVISTSPEFHIMTAAEPDSLIFCNSIEDARTCVEDLSKRDIIQYVFLIGGASLYNTVLKSAEIPIGAILWTKYSSCYPEADVQIQMDQIEPQTWDSLFKTPIFEMLYSQSASICALDETYNRRWIPSREDCMRCISERAFSRSFI